MSDALHQQLLALHRHYNQVAELQQPLPARRPRNDNHAVQEQRVREKAREVLAAARNVSCASTGYLVEVENIIAGCEIMQNAPYKKLGGIVRV